MATPKKVEFMNINELGSGESSIDGENEEKDNVAMNGGSKTTNNNETTTCKKSDAQILLTATLILDAKRGRNINFKTDEIYVRWYIFYHSWYLRWALYAFIVIDLCLAFFEKPSVTTYAAPYWATILVECLCLGFFIFRFCHAAYVEESGSFWKDTKHILVLGTIILTILDIICYIIWIEAAPDTHPVRWSRPLRPLFIVNFSDGKQVRRAFRNIRRTVPEIMNVLVLFFLSVLLFALLALKLFSKRSFQYPNGDPYFKTYWDCIWDLYVLVTTANNPDVMMPAYDYSNWFALFFVCYIIICLYIFMSIVLAAIYNNYKKNLKNEIRASVYSKRRKLNRAFEILKEKVGSHYVVTQETWNRVMNLVLPGKSQQQFDLLLRVLDCDGENSIKKPQFINLSDLLQVSLTEVNDRKTFIEQMIPSVYNHRGSKVLKWLVRTRGFRWFFDFLIFINAFFIGFDVDNADWFFLSIFSLEIFLKLYTFGPKEFVTRFWNVFDVLVIGAAVLASIIEKAIGASNEEFQTLDVLLVLRVMRLIKLFGSIQRFKVIIMTIVNIGPSILTYGGVIFVFYYFYAIIGMEVFANKIHFYGYNGTDLDPLMKHCGNVKLKNSNFYLFHYCNNNFNNILKAFVVLFELTVVNQWHVLTSGFVIVTSKAARIYFFCFHLTCVVIIMNIFTAFILEAFILEYSLQRQPRLESVVEAKIKELGLGIGLKPSIKKPKNDTLELVDNEVHETEVPPKPNVSYDQQDDDSDTESLPDVSQEQGLRFHLKKKSHKKVEVLLHQMFEGEIKDEDEGLEYDDYKPRPRRLTLETI